MAKKNTRPFVKLDYDALKFCHKEGYKIYPVTKDGVNFQIEMTLAHQKATLEEVYTQTAIHQALCDLYLKIYKSKYKDN